MCPALPLSQQPPTSGGNARGSERSRRCGARHTSSDRGQIFGANVHSCSSDCASSTFRRAYRSSDRGCASCAMRSWSPRARDRDARGRRCAAVRSACNTRLRCCSDQNSSVKISLAQAHQRSLVTG